VYLLTWVCGISAVQVHYRCAAWGRVYVCMHVRVCVCACFHV